MSHILSLQNLEADTASDAGPLTLSAASFSVCLLSTSSIVLCTP
ncbi:hypothetical protein [Streptomyces milbemycinicus]